MNEKDIKDLMNRIKEKKATKTEILAVMGFLEDQVNELDSILTEVEQAE